MNEQQAEEKVIDNLFIEAEKELQSLSDEEKQILASGLDNRGIECVTERWYLPDQLRGGSVSKIAERVRSISNRLSEMLYNASEEGS